MFCTDLSPIRSSLSRFLVRKYKSATDLMIPYQLIAQYFITQPLNIHCLALGKVGDACLTCAGQETFGNAESSPGAVRYGMTNRAILSITKGFEPFDGTDLIILGMTSSLFNKTVSLVCRSRRLFHPRYAVLPAIPQLRLQTMVYCHRRQGAPVRPPAPHIQQLSCHGPGIYRRCPARLRPQT